ncbi:MAG: Signal transduction histidine kinase, nitrogen specific [Candidatus Electronema aureum]|uniref:histidine kinase n=1 Tax=Candidatus Electronema aureum TaxID=2005002 RepID=A0A521G5H1_9BACT|nr:MAG: Signal transduction histidine kinase, nitrogen specific [Candidatus Electronema aureum]
MKFHISDYFTKKSSQDSSSAEQEDIGGQQPFALVKYFSFTSLTVILLASLILTWSFSRNTRKTILERSEIYSRMFAESLNRQVFYLFVLPTFVRYGRIALSDPVQFEQLDLIITDITRGMSIKSVTIFDSRENIISYATENALVGKKNAGGIEYQKALLGESSTVLMSSGSMLNLLLPGRPPVSCLLQTYVPFRQDRGSGQGEIMGVVAVTQDLSADMEALISLQFKIILVSLVVMSILFAVLSAIVIRADRIMEARAQERRELEKQLHESKRLAALGKMIASVSHEIKNPLGIVRSTAEIIAKRISKVAPGNEHLAAIIVQETTRLDGIVREFLDFARPKDLTLSSGSLNSLVERMTVFMEAEFTAKQIKPMLELDSALSEILMDGEQIYQVLLNIVFNAVHAMSEKGGTLTIRTRPLPEGGAMLEITDTGCGMSEEKMTQIFIPFYTDKNRGTGLGLSITKNIVEKHGGTITVQSKEGEGTTFAVCLGSETAV